jgi:hypothetical protein
MISKLPDMVRIGQVEEFYCANIIFNDHINVATAGKDSVIARIKNNETSA